MRTDNRTRFTQGNCGHLTNGDEIALEGELGGDATVYATLVELKSRLTADLDIDEEVSTP